MTIQQEIEKSDKIEYELYLTELNKETVKKISEDQNEPKRMLEHRIKSLEIFKKMPMPKRWPSLSDLNFKDFVYYAKPKKWYEGITNSRENVPKEIKNKFDKLWIPQAEKKYLAWVWWQMDSNNFYHKIKEKREKKWVIFEDLPIALKKHWDVIKKHFMKLVPPTDHKFSALHWAVWSWGTFIFIPKWLKVNEPLQAYFRMNMFWWGQFEHTLIILEDDTEASYIEWCSAPKYNSFSLHAWCVEVFVWKNSTMKYSSVENWSTNTFNLNTKRSLIDENWYMEWISWNLWSCVAMLYPCSILKWDNSKTDMYWVAVAWKWQNQDIWNKAIHLWKCTKSNIVSKSISNDWWIATYRWLVYIWSNAKNCTNNTKCDALILDDVSISNTVPTIKNFNSDSSIAHEATTWKINTETLFYLTSRWLTDEKATSLIVNGFFSSIVKKLPLEYAWEMNKLIEMEIEWM